MKENLAQEASKKYREIMGVFHQTMIKPKRAKMPKKKKVKICSANTEPCNPERRKNRDRGFGEQEIDYKNYGSVGKEGEWISAKEWTRSLFVYRRKCDIPPPQALREFAKQVDSLQNSVSVIESNYSKKGDIIEMNCDHSTTKFFWSGVIGSLLGFATASILWRIFF